VVHEDETFTVRELSEYLRVHWTTICRLLRQRLTEFRVGHSWRFKRDAIKQLEMLQRQGASPVRRRPNGVAPPRLRAWCFCPLCSLPSDRELVRVHSIEIASQHRELSICRKCVDAIRSASMQDALIGRFVELITISVATAHAAAVTCRRALVASQHNGTQDCRD
jgi:excisionase family DNA binding protein